MNTNPEPQAAATSASRWDGPTRVALVAATVAVCVVGYVASMFIANKGLVPQPTTRE